MENASKALIMAAGILIGLLVAGLFAYEMMVVSETGRIHQEQIDRENILEFNAQFEKYADKPLTAQEVAKIFNYITEWNKNNETYSITMEFQNYVGNGLDKLREIYLNPNSTVAVEDFLNDSWKVDNLSKNNRIYTIKITENSYEKIEGKIIKIAFRYIANDAEYEKYFEVK